eukprot:366228-Chlamydomonas_euryale.AAC.32
MNAGLVSGQDVPPEYVALVQPHVDSFDYFLQDGMQLAVDSMEPLEVSTRMSWERMVKGVGHASRKRRVPRRRARGLHCGP